MSIKFYEVGGCIRDELLGVTSKDVDFTVVGSPTFEFMERYLENRGFKIFQANEHHQTIRASVPSDHPLHERTKVADFVLARIDGPSKDGRRPEWTKPGTLLDDLSRRDFTVNALARDTETGEIIDHFGGQDDLKNRILRFVGDPLDRIEEDGLRVMRAWRFQITKGLKPTLRTEDALNSEIAARCLKSISIERIQEEMDKMFRFDCVKSMEHFAFLSKELKSAIFRDRLRLQPTLKG